MESSKGFIVQSVARFIIEYREGGNCISISVESDYALGQKPYEIVDTSTFRKWDNGIAIPDAKQKKIIQNFTEAMEFQGIGVIVR